MQILCFAFFMGVTMMLIIFAINFWKDEADQNSALYLIMIMSVTLIAYVAGLLISKVKLRNLIKKSISDGNLDLDAYQQLMIFKLSILEAPAIASTMFFFFLVGGSLLDGANLLFAVPVVIFYLSIFNVFPTRAKIDRIQELIRQGS